jgi:hypothetical protein
LTAKLLSDYNKHTTSLRLRYFTTPFLALLGLTDAMDLTGEDAPLPESLDEIVQVVDPVSDRFPAV